MTQGYISVIVPIYNAQVYLRKCIDSIIGQTYKNIEIILVDDGSDDGSASICDEFAAKDNRITVIKNNHKGAMAARKTGIAYASGEWITFADSDDWLEAEMYERMMASLSKYDADIVCAGYSDEAGNSKKEIYSCFEEGLYEGKTLKKLYPAMFYSKDMNWFGISANCWDKIFRKSVIFDPLMATDERIKDGDDHAFVYPALLRADRVYISHDILYHHRRHLSGSLSSDMNDDVFERFGYLYSDLKGKLEHSNEWDQISDGFNKQMRWFLIKYINRKLGLELYDKQTAQPPYIFPFGNVSKGTKIVLYGAGKVGKAYRDQILATEYCDIVSWVDRDVELEDVALPERISSLKFDLIVIAVADKRVSDQIKDGLMGIGVDRKKIIWENPYVYDRGGCF